MRFCFSFEMVRVLPRRQNVHTRNTDFKKFNVDVLRQISPPGK